MKLVDVKKTLIVTPAIDGRVEVGYCGGLVSSAAQGLVHNLHFLNFNSSISGARDKIANMFMRSEFEWLICIDSDIQFSTKDLQLLMSVEDYPANDDPAKPTLNEAGEEIAVTAEYVKKDDTGTPVRFGMGFVRLHRGVFEKLNSLRESNFSASEAEDGPELLGRYYEDGAMSVDYFPELCTPDARKLHEDTSFWTFVQYAGITPRIEQRTRLIHWGKKAFHYGGISVAG